MSDDLCFTEDDIIDAIGQLKSEKSGAGYVISENLKLSRSVIALPLSQLFTSIVRHGYYATIFAGFYSCSRPKEQQRYICEFQLSSHCSFLYIEQGSGVADSS